MNNFNQALFLQINDFTGSLIWLDWLGIFLAQYLPYLIVFGLVLAATVFSKYRRMIVQAILAGLIGRLLLVEPIRFFYHHPRPFITNDIQPLILENSWSFPSGHATFFFAVAATVWFWNRSFGWILFGLAVIMGLARIYVGVHWPIDIVGGLLTGLLAALVTRLFFPRARQ